MIRPYPWSEFGVLLGVGLAGVVAALPYVQGLLQARQTALPVPFAVVAGAQILQGGILLAIAVGLGLLASRATGMGAPIIEGWLEGGAVASHVRSAVVFGLPAGVITGAVLVGLEAGIFGSRVPPELKQASLSVPAWRQALAAFYGGITEELLTRLFLLSGVAWLLGLAWSSAAGQPATGAMWVATAVAAIAFAALHLPATTLVAPLTPLLLLRGLLLNGLGGLVFGVAYCYGVQADQSRVGVPTPPRLAHLAP